MTSTPAMIELYARQLHELAELAEMRGWLLDANLHGSPSELSNQEVMTNVRRYYHGGLAQFRSDLAALRGAR